MATYNGEKYIGEQLESLLAQTYTDWQLIVRDDCSSDKTMDILRSYQQKYPQKIQVIKAETPSGGAAQNFFKLLDYVENDYVMFCDQDDVWLPNKIALTMERMQESEGRYGRDMPILVHTDLWVVDENLQTLNPSFFAMAKMNPLKNTLNDLLVTNTVSGCTMMINKALLNQTVIPSRDALMHDSWIALVAQLFGEIVTLRKATLRYRQHGNNSCGVKSVNTMSYYSEKLGNLEKVHKGLVAQYRNAGEFKRVYGDKMTKEQIEMLDCYSRFDSMNIFQRLYYLKKYGLFKKGIVRKIGQLLV